MTKIGDGTACHDVGTHQLILEKPDIARIVWRGESTAKDIRELYDQTDAYFGVGTRFYALVDLSGLTVVGPESRKAAAAEPRAKLVLAIAYVGASFHMRIVMTMFNKALRMINGEKTAPMAFFPTLDAARQWIDADRNRRAAA
jgi:hypothetical protein